VAEAGANSPAPGDQNAASRETASSNENETAAPPAPPRPPADTSSAASEAPAVDGTAQQTANAGEPAPADVVELRAKADSWIQLRDGQELLLTRLLRKGEVFRVPERGGLTLMTGNAGGLEVLVNGKLMPPIGNEGVVARGVPLDPQHLQGGGG
jgi:hypothetical protein